MTADPWSCLSDADRAEMDATPPLSGASGSPPTRTTTTQGQAHGHGSNAPTTQGQIRRHRRTNHPPNRTTRKGETMSTTDQLEAERRAVTLAIYGEDKGQVDEYANECHSTRQRYERMADVAIEASALPLRNAQVEAVWSKLESLDSLAQIEPDDDDYSKGINIAASIIRRAIESAS